MENVKTHSTGLKSQLTTSLELINFIVYFTYDIPKMQMGDQLMRFFPNGSMNEGEVSNSKKKCTRISEP